MLLIAAVLSRMRPVSKYRSRATNIHLNTCVFFPELGTRIGHVPGVNESVRMPGPGSADSVRAPTEFGPGSHDDKTLYRTFRAVSGSFFPPQRPSKKVICTCAHPVLVTQSGCGNKSHRLDFLGDYRSCPPPPPARRNTDSALQTWHPLAMYRSSKAKMTSEVIKASLNNSSIYYWHL
jgi:hypothetical protein